MVGQSLCKAEGTDTLRTGDVIQARQIFVQGSLDDIGEIKVTLTRCKKRSRNIKKRSGQAVSAIVDGQIPERALKGRSISNHIKSVYTKRLYAYANLLTDKHLQVRRCQTFRFPSRRPQRYLPVSVRGEADCYLHLLLSLAQYVPRNAL